VDGVRRIPQDRYDLAVDKYNIAIDEITINDTPVPQEAGVYQLPAGVGRLVLRPAILNYSMTNPTVHYYIEGVPESDITAKQDGLSSITLTDIKYGDYTLHIRVLDDVTGAVQQERIFPIHKAPKMYEQTYYRAYVVAITLLFVAFIAWMIAQMRSLSTIEQQYEEIRIAKDEAEVANKAKSNFLASMSHEIRTPINAVLGMDEMILRESKDSSILEYAMDIYSAGQTLLSLINEILDSSKIESGKMEIVPEEYELGEMIHNLHNLIIQRASVSDLSLIVEVDKSLPKKLRGDDVRVRQIITNMLSNAVKYTKEGTVWFRILGVCEDGVAHLRIEVEDTGEGIKEEDLPHLFDAYRRLDLGKNHYVEGTGLGLNIAMHLLELMGSKLQVHSVLGEGSKFYFDLDQEIVDATPLGEDYDPTSSRNIVAHRTGGHFIAPKARVLVVDDNSMNRRVFKSLVKEMQMQVSEAASGPEAIEFAKTEYFDLIFMDHMMPEMDGVEAMQYIRSLKDIPCEHTPIYVLTANAITGAKEAYLEAGFDGFVSKPIIFEKLEEALQEALPPEYIEPMPEGTGPPERTSGPQVPDDLPSVEGLDWSFAWLHLPSVDLLKESLTEFYTLIPVQSRKLEAMYEALMAEESAEALEHYRILVHAMKGLAATVGIIPLAGPAKILEFAAKDGNIDVIRNLHPVFIREWNSYSQKLVGVFDIGAAHDASRQPGNLKILQKLSDIIIEALKHMDIDRADKAVAKLQEFTFGDAVDADITTLVGAVTDLDEELSKATLEEMISKLQE
ncbi:MAG: response regulator, partial [Lachnospiraceae bacterium]|nr:response regulator [Lachnospiraceae bacterium]